VAVQERIQLYTAFFAILCLVSILLLFFQFGQTNASLEYRYITIGTAGWFQVIFSIVLALSIVQGARLNDAALLHRFRLSRVETLVCDLLVRAETPNAMRDGAPNAAETMLADPNVQRHLRLTRSVASSLSASLAVETAILPARVLFIPANYALLSTFWSLSISGILSAVRTLNV